MMKIEKYDVVDGVIRFTVRIEGSETLGHFSVACQTVLEELIEAWRSDVSTMLRGSLRNAPKLIPYYLVYEVIRIAQEVCTDVENDFTEAMR